MLGWGVLQNISGDFVANEIVMKYIHPISRDVLYSISLKSINTSKMNLDVGKFNWLIMVSSVGVHVYAYSQ